MFCYKTAKLLNIQICKSYHLKKLSAITAVRLHMRKYSSLFCSKTTKLLSMLLGKSFHLRKYTAITVVTMGEDNSQFPVLTRGKDNT